MIRPIPSLAVLLSRLLLGWPVGASDARADTEATQRWKTWKQDLEYLYEVIEKPATLKLIFKAKGIQ